MCASMTARRNEIEYGATLRPDALRSLCAHSAAQLNAEWRALSGRTWTHAVRTAQGCPEAASETVWMRTRELCLHAIDLDNGAAFHDVPADVQGRELQAADRGRAPRHRPARRGFRHLAGLAEWATGRGTSHVTSPAGRTPAAPRWL